MGCVEADASRAQSPKNANAAHLLHAHASIQIAAAPPARFQCKSEVAVIKERVSLKRGFDPVCNCGKALLFPSMEILFN
jgi:hypothetical protein